MRKALLLIFAIGLSANGLSAQADTYKVYGKVLDEKSKQPFESATVFVRALNIFASTNEQGYYELALPKGKHKIEVFSLGMMADASIVEVSEDQELNFVLIDLSGSLQEVEVYAMAEQTSGISRLQAIEGFGIYEAKKNELIVLDDFAANKVANNARQIFAKVPGLNIWESDFAGLQLDIAARGLGPSRTANFNSRQNGYDMSADALGYPESYYMPAMQAVERIEIVRGAASLQYGTQFGGMLNFKMKEAPEKPFELNVEQAAGSFGLLNSFVSVGGTKGIVDYYGYYQYRRGDGWRESSGFDSHLAYSRIGVKPSEKLKLGFEYSFLDYNAQQPGGLTDEDFRLGNLKQARRDRNWFRVNWNLLASTVDYEFSANTKLNIRSFGLFSSREALGNLAQIDRIDDPNSNRTLISDEFQNFGTEARLLKYFNFRGQKSAFLVGARYYNGLTDRKQGDANPSTEAEFAFLNPNDLEDFDYDFPSNNLSIFTENVLNITDKFSLTAGLRFEHIVTKSVGTWKQIVRDFAGNTTAENNFEEDRSVVRSFALLGLGASYYLKDDLSLYANFAENFRSVTFSDLRLNNPNFVLDSLITDESGYNIDLGIRGNLFSWLNVDISVFYLKYNDRIGILLPPASSLLFRTNIGDSRHYGLEAFTELDVFKLLKYTPKETSLSIFTNLSLIDAVYVKSQDSSIKGKKVEYVPEVMLRSGVNFKWKNLKATYQVSYLGEQFSDATNSTFNPSALTGTIPSYMVMDLSLEYTPNRYKFTCGLNNLANEQYFTRRAEAYPGPGIIPATPRSFYMSVGVRL